jgi:hypothetical protein
MDITVSKQAARTQTPTITHEQIVAVACVTLLPLLYIVGKALMTVIP